MKSRKEIPTELLDKLWKKYLQQLPPPCASPAARKDLLPPTLRATREKEFRHPIAGA